MTLCMYVCTVVCVQFPSVTYVHGMHVLEMSDRNIRSW